VSTMQSPPGTSGALTAPARLSNRPTLPAEGHFAARLGTAIDKCGLTYRQIAAEVDKRFGGTIRISHVTIWGWAKGTRLPRRRVEEAYKLLAVESVLGLPVGDLILDLPYAPEVSPLYPPMPTTTGSSDARRYAAFFHSVYHQKWKPAATASQQMLIRSVKKTYSLIRAHEPQCMTVEMDVLAVRDGTRRYVLMHAVDPSWQPQITPILGCVIGDTLTESTRYPVKQVHRATEIFLPKTINRGDTARLGFVIGYAGPASDREFRHILVQPIDQLDLILQFEGPAARRVRNCFWRVDDLELVTAVSTTGRAGRYEISLKAPAPGGYGWTW
jgi:hypothetical protein